MSGHSKWSQIKRQKGVADAKRGQAFTKLGSAITIAVREGGGIADPNSNFRLRLVMEKAREANMPKENIQRAIDRALGKDGAGRLEEIKFEGFGPMGTAVIIETVTDNHLRTQAAVKNYLDRNNGNLGSNGAVAYLFSQSGLITISKNGKTADDIFLQAADAGAEDIEDNGGEIDIYTKPQDLHKVKKSLEDLGIKVISCELIMKPNSLVKIEGNENVQKMIGFLEGLEDLDDVQKVFTNADLSPLE